MPTPNWLGTWQLLVAFNNNIFDDLTAITTVASPAGTLGATNVWTDISQWVIDAHPNRGRQHAIDRFTTGTLDATLWAVDGRFDGWNTSGPYTGLIDAGKPVRLQVTINGTTYPVWTGYADVWDTQWPDELHSTVRLSCVDAFQAFNYGYCVSPLYPKQVIADGASAYFRLGDPVGSTTLTDSTGNGHIFTVGNGSGNPAAPIAFGSMLGGPPALANNTGSSLTLPANDLVGRPLAQGLNGVPAPADLIPTTATAVSKECWLQTTNTGSWGWDTLTFSHSGNMYSIAAGLGSTGITLYYNANTSNVAGTATGITPADGNWHHVVITADIVAGTAQLFFDGVRVVNATGLTFSPITSLSGLTLAMLYEQVENLGPNSVGVQEVSYYPTALTTTQVSNHFNLGGAGPVESSGARLGRILNWVSWAANMRSIDAGSSNVQAISQNLTGTTLLSYFQLVELSENGALFMDKSGNVRFIARQNLLKPPYTTNQATFGDGGGETPFEPTPQMGKDTLDLYSEAQIQRQGGLIQTWPAPQATNTPATKYGPRFFQPDQLLVTTDQEALYYAQWEYTHLSTPLQRVRSINIHPLTDPTGGTVSALVAGLELMQLVTVNRHNPPGGGSAFSQSAQIEGISHQVDFKTGDWMATLALAPAGTQSYWILGTSQIGVNTRLAY